MMRIRFGIGLLLVAGLLNGAVPNALAAQNTVYTIGVVPSQPPVTLHTVWAPLVERLSRDTGVPLRLKVYEKMADFERDVWAGAPDLVFASPIQTVVAHQRHGYEPLVRGGNPVSIKLFVRTESPISTLEGLSGKRIAFVGNKNMCSVFIRHVLAEERDKLDYLTEFSGSTDNVIKSVLIGKTDAGAVFAAELERSSEEVRNRTRTLMDSPKFAPHPISAHPRVPKKVRQELTRAVLALTSTADGRELLSSVRMVAPVTADYVRDYQRMEDIDVVGMTDWGN